MAVLSDDDYRLMARSLRKGQIVPFLGAGVNLCDRPANERFARGKWLPSGGELAEHLAKEFFYPRQSNQELDLLRVSQYVTIKSGAPDLYEELHNLFDANYPPTTLHRFLAHLPALYHEQDGSPYQLIITTNYDDALERAFAEADEDYDLISYIAQGDENVGKFWHIPPGGPPRVIERPNEYDLVSPDKRTVIVKIHGMVNRINGKCDSFVITEDDYIEYLTRTDISSLLPVKLVAKLRDRDTRFLFLGYSLRDWNLRVILHRLWGVQKMRSKSWAVQRNTDEIEKEFWRDREVRIFDMPLNEYVARLRAIVDEPRGARVKR